MRLTPQWCIVVQVGVVHDIRLQELRLFTDAGRCCRPLFIVEDQQLLIKKGDIHKLNSRETTQYGWQDLIFNGYIECASNPRRTCIAPLMLLRSLFCA